MNRVAHAPLGLLLAAGRGSRLGGSKQLLPIPTAGGDVPLVAAAFDAIAPVCARMLVVLGHEVDRVVAALGPRTFARVSSNPDAPMFESIRAGLAACRDLDPTASVLLHPADHPFATPATLAALLAAASPHAAVTPRHQGKGGHPVLIPPQVRDRVLTSEGEGGLRRFWLDHPDLRVHLDVDDPGITLDLDTPADYARLRESLGSPATGHSGRSTPEAPRSPDAPAPHRA